MSPSNGTMKGTNGKLSGHSVLTDSCYPDKSLKTLTVDVGFYISRYYSLRDELQISVDDLDSNAEVTNWFIPLIAALRALGGSARRPDVHNKIIEMCHITDKALSEKNTKSNTSKIINNIDWARNYLAYEGIISKETKGTWTLTMFLLIHIQNRIF